MMNLRTVSVLGAIALAFSATGLSAENTAVPASLVDCLVDQKDVVEALPLMVSSTRDERWYGGASIPPANLTPDSDGMVRWKSDAGQPMAGRIDPTDGRYYFPFLHDCYAVLFGGEGVVVHDVTLLGAEVSVFRQALPSGTSPLYYRFANGRGEGEMPAGDTELAHPSPASYLSKSIDVAVAHPPSEVQVLKDGSTRLVWRRGPATRVATFELHDGLQALSLVEIRVEDRLVHGEYWSEFVEVGGAALPRNHLRFALDREGDPTLLSSWSGVRYVVLDAREFQSLANASADEVIAFGSSIAGPPHREDPAQE